MTVLAAILDFFTAFFVIGYAVALATGDTTGAGFELNGAPALIAIFGVVAYFVVLPRYGGTLWQRILRTRARGTSQA